MVSRINYSDKKILCILAHPDDESLGTGSTIAYYSKLGVAVSLICATRGERGRYFDEPSPGPTKVGEVRTQELLAAAKILGITNVHFLDYMDGELDAVNPIEITNRISELIQKISPDIVISFGPDGAYGHPDHIAISQFSMAAIIDASHKVQVKKFYYMAWPEEHWKHYTAAFKKLQSKVDGEIRLSVPWPEWAITTRIDTATIWETTWKAIQCHKTQLTGYGGLLAVSNDDHKKLWGLQEFYRVFSLVNGGRKVETDLFEGF